MGERTCALVQNLLGLGLEGKDLHTGHIVLRCMVVLIATLAMVRMSSKRFLARRNAFDVVLAFILGSLLSRAINGSARFGPTLIGGFCLVLLHRFMGWAAIRWPRFEHLIKGRGETLINNGCLDEKAMARNHVSNADLEEDLRLDGAIDGLQELTKVKHARIERNGCISVMRHAAAFNLEAEPGVQNIHVDVEG